jgi:6-phosphogluconate dehydrogenase
MMRIGLVGLGRIGGGLAAQALEKGMEVVGYDIQGGPPELRSMGLQAAGSLHELTRHLEPPRAILLYVPAGAAVDEALEALLPLLDPRDIVADGGNSYWREAVGRAARLQARGVAFLDVGTSGGLAGARGGACFMAGGPRDAFTRLEPTLSELAVPGGVVYCGPWGCGHFAKLVHNGIEFGMMQAIGEGLALLESHPEPLPLADIVGCWRNGSVIRSWLVDLLHQAMSDGLALEQVPGYVEDTGEVNWLVEDALEREIPIPVIAQSVMQLFASRDETKSWARAVAMMRHGFGGHPYGPDETVAEGRRTGRVSEK